MVIRYVLPPGSGHTLELLGLGRHDYGDVHFYLAVAAVLLLGVHLWLHWRWVCSVTCALAGAQRLSRSPRARWGLSTLAALTVVAVAVGGAGSLCTDRIPGLGGLASHDRGTPPPQAPYAAPRARERTSAAPAAPELDQGAHCPEAAAINGRISFAAAARACGMSVEQLRGALRLPPLDPHARLGRLARQSGLDILELRRIACERARRQH